jgi:DNA polymerase-3 subunit delta'
MQVLADEGLKEPERWLASGRWLAGFGTRSGGIRAERLAGIACIAPGVRAMAADPLAVAAELEKMVKDSKGKLQLKQVVDALQKWLVDLTLARNGLPFVIFWRNRPQFQGWLI